jgi:hypothetical protein
MINDSIQRLYTGKTVSIGRFASGITEGREIVLLAKSRPNRKTGLMIQIAILDPEVDQGKNTGDVPNGQGCFKGGCSAFDACYVRALPMHMWAIERNLAEYNQGEMPAMNLEAFLAYVEGSGIPVRFGEFGDPSALPFEVVERIAQSAKQGWTGYTHYWRTCDQRLKQFLMASVESEADFRLAKSMGWNCFWINGSVDQAENRIECLNTSKGLSCADCRLCRGTTFKMDVVIQAHGKRSKKVGIGA